MAEGGGFVAMKLRKHVNVLGSVGTSRAPRMSLRMQGVVRFFGCLNEQDG